MAGERKRIQEAVGGAATNAAVETGFAQGQLQAATENSSQNLTQKIAEAVARIQIEQDGDTITLRGSVPSKEAKAEAESAAKSVRGVKKVKNELQVGKEQREK